MALALRGFILGAPKPNMFKIPSCKSNQQKAMTMLQQTQHLGLKHSRKISYTLITCRSAGKPKPPIGKGKGPGINQTPSSEQLNSNLSSSSSNSERMSTGNKSNGEANATQQR